MEVQKQKRDIVKQMLESKTSVADTQQFAQAQYVSVQWHIFSKYVYISMSLYLSVSPVTYAGLGIDLGVCWLGYGNSLKCFVLIDLVQVVEQENAFKREDCRAMYIRENGMQTA